MSHVTLVRHGQANSSARDELGYDRLSELGWQQAEWLWLLVVFLAAALQSQMRWRQGLGNNHWFSG